MAQFDVHRNTGKQRDAIPYVVVVQSSLYDAYRRRVAIPLNPVFTVKGVAVVLHPLEIVSVAAH